MKNVEGKQLNVFRLLRIARDIKVTDLARELSVTPAYIHAIEKGERFPSERLLDSYAESLDVDVDTLLTFRPEPGKNHIFENALLSLLQLICKEDSRV